MFKADYYKDILNKLWWLVNKDILKSNIKI